MEEKAAGGWKAVVTQSKTRSFTEFILSTAEGFRMTTPIKCHSERQRKIFLVGIFAESLH
jgi:hypothetical protein